MPSEAVSTSPSVPMDVAHVREYLDLIDQKKKVSEELEGIKSRITFLEGLIVDMLIGAGMDGIDVNGRRVRLTNQVWVGRNAECDRYEVIHALKNCEETAPFVVENYNDQTLRAWAKSLAESVQSECLEKRELFDESKVQEALPEGLRDVLRISFGKGLSNVKAR